MAARLGVGVLEQGAQAGNCRLEIRELGEVPGHPGGKEKGPKEPGGDA
jgi:hypothetical protein